MSAVADVLVDVLVAHPLATAMVLALPALAVTVCRVCVRALDRARASWAEEQAIREAVRR
jgi:hypothetical protein